eukprot:TRINITY_DN17547_c0_g1_i1.p1 TRINITY_DN17547_c0_g1~~TRINITY_DN17547_c0_g1_i1.p1  ORF type:complete len:518 (+),score=72.76 TRINITY_DN17547_c0_g1_i1:240-1793(+)
MEMNGLPQRASGYCGGQIGSQIKHYMCTLCITFRDPQMEADFKKSCEASLLQWLSLFTLAGGTLCVWGTFRFMQITTSGVDRPIFEWSFDDPRTFSYLLYMAISALAFVVNGCTVARLRWNYLRKLDWEFVLVGVAIVTMLFLWLANPGVICSVLGADPFESWGGDPRASLQPVGNWMTVILMGVPICSVRAHLHGILGLLFVLLHVALEVVLPQAWPGEGFRADTNSAVFIVGFACLGTWCREKGRRDDWLRVKALQASVEEVKTRATITEKMVDMFEEELAVVRRDLHVKGSSAQAKEAQVLALLGETKAMEDRIAALKKEVSELEYEGRTRVAPLPGDSKVARAMCDDVVMPLRQSSSPRSELNGKFDGQWTVCKGKVRDWLRRLDIEADRVVLGDGTMAKLTKSLDGKVLLEGGVLEMDGDILERRGKSGATCSFRRDHARRAMLAPEVEDRKPSKEQFRPVFALPDFDDLERSSTCSTAMEAAGTDVESGHCLPGQSGAARPDSQPIPVAGC